MRCELCAAPIGEVHPHVVELAGPSLRCACQACAILFRDPGAAGGRYRTVPTRILRAPDFSPSDAEWARLGIPVRLAFVVRRGGQLTAFYPSPGGAVPAPLEDEAARAWDEVPLARALEPDIEALLVDRPRNGAARCLLVPIDLCYELVALVRRTWRGFSGGDEAAQEIDAFVARLEARAEGARP